MAIQAGQAWIQVNPSLRGFHRKVREQIAKELGRDVEIPVKPKVEPPKDPAAPFRPYERAAKKSGEDSGGGFARAFRQRVDAALKSIPEIHVDADTSEADTEIAGLRTRLQALRDLRIGVDIDAGEALAEIQAVQTRLQQISGDDARIDVRADTAAAAAQLAAIDAQASALDGRDVNIDVNVDRDGSARAGLNDMSRGVYYASSQVSNLAIAGGLIAPALVPGLGAAAAAAFGLGAALASAGIGVGGLVAAVIPAFQNITQVTQAQVAADKSAATTAVQSSQQRVNAAYQAEQAARRVADARLSADRAAIDGARRVADAQEAADRTAIEGARRVVDAREQVARAQERAADMVEAAERRVANAARAVADAQRAEQRAQENLTAARQDAIRELERMRELVSDLALDEQSAQLAIEQAQLDLAEIMGQTGGTAVEAAQIALADAQANLNALQSSGSASALELAQAQLAVSQAQEQLNAAMHAQEQLALDQQQAQLDLAEAQDHLSDIQQQQVDAQNALNEAEQQGIDGMPQVVAAQEALANASQGVADALADQQLAQEELVDAQVDAARAVADAQEELARAQEQAAQANADAQQQIADAQEQAARANADAARAVQDALAAQAQGAQQSAAAMDQGSAAARNLAYAMGQLTPMQQQLLAGWVSLRDAFTAWAESLEPHTLPVFIKAFALLEQLLPLLSPIVIATADAFSYLLDLASNALQDPFWIEFFDFLAAVAGPNVAMFGEILGNLARGFAGLTMAFQPLVSQVMTGLVGWSEAFADWGSTLEENDQFQAFIDYILDIWPQLRSTLGALFSALGNIVEALAPLAGPVLAGLEAVFNFIANLPHSVIVGIGAAVLALAIGLQVAAAAAAIAAAPVAAVIALVAGLAVGLIYAWNTSETFRDKVLGAVEAVRAGFWAAWNWLMMWVINPIIDFFTVKIPGAAVALRDGTVAAWNGLRDGFWAGWNWLVANVFNPVRTFFTETIPGAAGELRDGVTGAFWAMVGGLRTAKDWMWENVISPIRVFFDDLLTKAGEIASGIIAAFTSIPEAVGNAFGTIVDFLLRPVNAVIGWINKHMIGNLNKVLGVFNVSIPTIPPIGGSGGQGGGGGGPLNEFHHGGGIAGDGGGRANPFDTISAKLQPGEGIITAPRMDQIARDHGVSPSAAIDGINSGRIDPTARGGAFDFIGDIAHGTWGAISGIGSQIGDWLKSGAAYALEKIMTPIVSGVVHVIPGPEFVQDYFRGALDHAKDKIVAWGKGKDHESEGSAPGKVPGGVPDMAGGAWAFPLPRGSYRVGRGTAGHGYPAQDFPAPAGTPVFAPFAGRLAQKSLTTSYGKHANLYAGPWRVILAHFSSHVGGPRMVSKGELIGRVGTTGNSTGNHLHAEGKRNGRGVEPRSLWKYDQGGYLPQGLTLAFNGTGQKERILDPSETRAYESMSGMPPMVNNFYGTKRGLANEVAMDLAARRQAFRPLVNH